MHQHTTHEPAHRRPLVPGRFELWVSLPQNRVDLAQAACAGGAHGLKLHLNIHHRASGTRFGTFQESREILEAIRSSVDVPIGVVAGDEQMASPAELVELGKMGFSFVDVYLRSLPALWLRKPPIPLMAALGHGYDASEPAYCASTPEISFLEASIVDPAQYGKPLTAADLAGYAYIRQVTQKPLLVPTQKAVLPEEVELLARVSADGILIGAVVTGTEPSELERATRAFRAGVDAL